MRYEMKDMIQAAADSGFSATPRLVHDWVSEGLLAPPLRRGRGRARGIEGTWSEEQQQLFCLLLDKRRSVNRIAPLCNIPVWTWMYFGDSHVPLPQVRRALATWMGWTTDVSWTAAKRAAREVFNDAGRPDARRSDRQAFLEAAAHMFFHLPRTFDETELRPLLMRICDPNGSGLSRTIGGMEFTPDAYLGLMRARLRALDALGRTHVDESLFHWARYTNIVARAGYRSLLARMTTPATAGEVIALPGVEQTAVNACRDLVTMLGLGLGMPVAVTRSLEDPAVWEKENLRSIVRGEYAEGGVTVTVSVQSEEEPGKKTADR